MSTPLVYGEHGELLGMDFRQSPLAAPEVRVPGTIPMHAVLPGDGIRYGDADGIVTVLRVRAGSRTGGPSHLICKTTGGALLAFEARPFDQVDVVSMGAFTPAGVS